MAASDPASDFPEAHRRVFAYFNGERAAYGDPMAIDRRFYADLAGEDYAALAAQVQSKDPATSGPAAERFEAAVRAAFRLAPFDEATGLGMTGGQVEALWGRYNDWLDAVKPASGTTPSSSPSTGTPPTPADPAAAAPAPDPAAAPLFPTPTPTPAFAGAEGSPPAAAGT